MCSAGLVHILLLMCLVKSCQTAKPAKIIGKLSENGDYHDDTKCGRRFVDTSSGWRIFGGTSASKGSFPWQVSIQIYGQHFCGATIINKFWLLTAAHCFDEIDSLDGITVVVGATDLTRWGKTETRLNLQTAFVHGSYHIDHLRHDIALVKLVQAIEYSKYVQPICLNKKFGQFDHNDQTCYMTGWGYTLGTGDQNHLQQLKSPITKQSDCVQSWNDGDITSGNICGGIGNKGVCDCFSTGSTKAETDNGYSLSTDGRAGFITLFGDSGGPFQCRGKDGRFYQVGITSFATENCHDYGYPSVFTRVSKYVDWIYKIMDKY